jgi:hypothetical protein
MPAKSLPWWTSPWPRCARKRTVDRPRRNWFMRARLMRWFRLATPAAFSPRPLLTWVAYPGGPRWDRCDHSHTGSSFCAA